MLTTPAPPAGMEQEAYSPSRNKIELFDFDIIACRELSAKP
jgi:hypothetical protein